MGKIILKGPVPADDPMFSEGWSIVSVRSPRLKNNLQKDKASHKTEDSSPESQNSSETPPESKD